MKHEICYDLIIVLDNGVVIEKGTHNKLMLNGGFYKRLAEKQLENADSIKFWLFSSTINRFLLNLSNKLN